MALPVPKEQAEGGTWREKQKQDSVLILFFFLLLSSFSPSTIFFSYLLSLFPLSCHLYHLSCFSPSPSFFIPLSLSLSIFFPYIYIFCLWPFLPAPTQGLQILRLVKRLDSPSVGVACEGSNWTCYGASSPVPWLGSQQLSGCFWAES